MSSNILYICNNVENGKTISPSIVNPLSKVDPSGNWNYYLHNFSTDKQTNLTLYIQKAKGLKTLYYVLCGNGGSGGTAGTITGNISSSNYPGGGGGGGCGQIYPTTTSNQSGNSYPVFISNPVFPGYVSKMPKDPSNFSFGNFSITLADGYSGMNGNKYNGGEGGHDYDEYDQYSSIVPGLSGQGGIGGIPNGISGYPTAIAEQRISFADGTSYSFKANIGGTYDPKSSSKTNGYGNGGNTGYVLFYYNDNDILK